MQRIEGGDLGATGGTLDQICEKDKKNVIKRENLFQLYADQPVGMGYADAA